MKNKKLDWDIKQYVSEYFKDLNEVSELKFWSDFKENCMDHDTKGGFSSEVNDVMLSLIKEKVIELRKGEDGKTIRYLL